MWGQMSQKQRKVVVGFIGDSAPFAIALRLVTAAFWEIA